MPRMLVTGAAGVVGSYVPEVFSDWELLLTDHAEGFLSLDVRDPLAVEEALGSFRPEVVLHLAAATDVDRCEQDPDLAFHSNAIGAQNVALACMQHEITLLYVSTGAVFWGDKPEPYTEFDTPRPANVYGHSKWAGEQMVASLLRRYYIVRAGWMMGGGQRDKKFVGKIAQLMLQGHSRLKIVNDRWGSPTYAKDLLRGIQRLLTTGYYGLYHLVNQGFCSRYDLALLIREVLGRPGVVLEPVSSDFFSLPAPRGRSEALRNLKLKLLGLDSMRTWQEALAEYLQTEFLPTRVAP